jgi:oxygen-independent coproporphyrinogen-3 oxidase
MNLAAHSATGTGLWPYYPDLLRVPVPRYTSFPTAAEFGPGVGAEQANAALRAIDGDVSLYVHIPFCEQICWYCGCNTGVANRRQRLSSYLDALHREIAITGARLGKEARVRRIAFGGGSPNAIAPTDFVRLLDALTLHMPLDAPVWSIELDPRTLTEEWCEVLGWVGVTRASLGVQTFAPELQERIGRVQPREQIARGVELLRKAGVTSLNFDLMYGLPGQTAGHLAETLGETDALGADRIALFGYAHVPHLVPRQRRIDASTLPAQAQRFAFAEQGHSQLLTAGYVPVGFDHFARSGDPLARAAQDGTLRRNFQGFTDDAAPTLIGLGASAIGSAAGLHWQNEKNAGRYRMLLSQDLLPAANGIKFGEADQWRARVIEALLCQGEARVDPDLLGEARPALMPFIERGLVRIEGDVLRIALPQGLAYSRAIAARFDPYRQDSLRRFSSAV